MVRTPYNELIIEYGKTRPEDRSKTWKENWAQKARDLMDTGELSEAQLDQIADRFEELDMPVNA